MLYIGKNIKVLRTEKKLSQARLASQLGIVPGTISNYENGVSTPDFEILEKLIKILDVSAQELLYEDLSEKSFHSKTPKNATLMNGGEKGGKKGGIPKLQKTPPLNEDNSPTETDSDSDSEVIRGQENVFTGMTDTQIEDMLTSMFRDRLLEMYETGRAAPAVEVRRYQKRIEELSAQVARLEFQINELQMQLTVVRQKKTTKRNELQDDTK